MLINAGPPVIKESSSDLMVAIKAMHKPENSVIPCSAEIDLNGITTVGNFRTSIFEEITGF